jgi:hypothetical protein
MPDDLDAQIEAYDRLLPDIKARHGSTWVIIADEKFVAAFGAFPEAAKFAHEHYPQRAVLIRHTDSRKVETAPFIHVHAEA